MQYNTLTVDSGKTLNTAGFTVMCSVLLTNNGTITDSSSGGAGGASRTYGGDPSKAGAGKGGDGGFGEDGRAGATGGKGGGVVRIFAKTLTNNGTIHANGSNAAALAEGEYAGACGGDGGTVILYYDARTVGTVTATGGVHSDGIEDGVDSYVKLMIHGDEEDGTSGIDYIQDSSASDHMITAHGAATTESYKKFGNASIHFDGSNDYLELSDHADWNLGSGDWTIDFWYRQSTVDSSFYHGICGQYATSQTQWYIYIKGGHIYFVALLDGFSDPPWITGNVITTVGTMDNVLPNINQWYHIEICRNSSSITMYVDGTMRFPYSNSYGPRDNSLPDYASPLYIGMCRNTAEGYYYASGQIEEFRFSKGIVRHTATFTPRTQSYSAQVDGTDGDAGTTSWVNLPYSAFSSALFRGALVNGTTLYAVVGANILSITTTGLTTVLGTVTTTTGNVFMASNGVEVLIVDGTTAGRFITISSGAISNVTLPGEASSCAFCDGYFIITHLSTQEIFISGLYDASSWDAGDHEYVEGSPDNLLRVMHCNHMLWMFGVSTIEVWYNSGAADFPFARISGALIDKGLGATASVTLIDNQFYFLSDKFEVLRTVGYQFEKISTIHIETEIQGYATKSDAIGYEYRIDGHIFYVLTFPTADATWVFDSTTGFWHEWQSYKTQGTATFGRHRGSIGFFFNGKYMVGDHTNGKIYELDMTTYTDDGEYIKRTRRTQYINKDRKRVAHFEVDLEFESGVGLGGTSDPQVGLTWSDDGGNNWATIQYRDLGEYESYKARQRWLRLGMARNRIYELTMYEPVKFVLIGSSANIEGEAS